MYIMYRHRISPKHAEVRHIQRHKRIRGTETVTGTHKCIDTGQAGIQVHCTVENNLILATVINNYPPHRPKLNRESSLGAVHPLVTIGGSNFEKTDRLSIIIMFVYRLYARV